MYSEFRTILKICILALLYEALSREAQKNVSEIFEPEIAGKSNCGPRKIVLKDTTRVDHRIVVNTLIVTWHTVLHCICGSSWTMSLIWISCHHARSRNMSLCFRTLPGRLSSLVSGGSSRKTLSKLDRNQLQKNESSAFLMQVRRVRDRFHLASLVS